MFEINYKIIEVEYEDTIKGTEGFFQINCNNNFYGEYYPIELESVMDKVSIYDWFERILRVAI